MWKFANQFLFEFMPCTSNELHLSTYFSTPSGHFAKPYIGKIFSSSNLHHFSSASQVRVKLIVGADIIRPHYKQPVKS